ncbi:MAG: T9SS type A sorting domain-containing protein [Bacteroidales bacterium]|nr:T9SS type A sorting domain-containing protein [Bacteroidales bacterium]
MKFFKLTSLIFYILLVSSSFAQEWTNSRFFSSDDDITIDYIRKNFNGDIVIAGTLKGTYSDTDTTIIANSIDIFLAKFDSDYNKKWFKVIGGDHYDFDPVISIDENDNIYVLGTFLQTCKFTPDDSLIADFIDVFLVKYDQNGNHIWNKHIGSNLDRQYAQSIDIDKNGDIIGAYRYRNSTTFIDTTITGRTGKYNNILFKVDQNGVRKNIKNVISNETSLFTSIKAFSDGYYINGQFKDSLLLDISPIKSYSSTKDVFLYKTDFDFDGVWVRRSYGDGDDFTGTITQDNYGNIYYTGYYNSSNFHVDSTSYIESNVVLSNQGNTDIYITKYNKSGDLIWLKNFGGKGSDWARSIEQKNDYLFLTGYFSDTINYEIDTLVSSDINDLDFFIGYLDLSGNVLGGDEIITSGSLDNDSGTDVLVNDDNTVTVAGYFKSETAQIGLDIYSNASVGSKDAFLAKNKPLLVTIYTDITEISCNGETDGSLTVTPYFGTAPYTYSWSHDGSLNDSVASTLAAGAYTVTVTDANSDTDEVSYTLIEPAPINFNPSITNITACSYSLEGAIDLNMSGGNGGFEYQWQATNGGFGAVFNVEDQSGLTIGTYNVSVTDVNQCIADTSIILTGPDPVVFTNSIVTDSSSLGLGAIDLQYSGGFGVSFTFDWEYPSGATATTEDISNLNTGNYNVTVTDAHACEFDTIFNVANLDAFYIFIEEYKDACKGTINGTATVSYYSPTSHTGIDYLWDGNAGGQTTAQATNLAPGRYYYVTVTDVENDPDIVLVDSVYIDELTYDFTGSLSGTSLLNCFGDADGYVDLTITSGTALPITYNWSTGSNLQDLTDVSVGSYSVTVTDDNSCQFSEVNFVINQPTALAISAEIVNEPSCNGDFDGEITVDRSGGTIPYSYQWNDPGFQNTRSADGLDAGFYTVTVTDNNSCSASSGINLTEPDEISVLKVVSDESCNTSSDGFASLTVSGGTSPFSYFWSTTNGTGLNITDKDQSGLTAGDYYFTITDNNNCTFDDSVKILEPVLLEITLEETTNGTSCTGVDNGSINITATGGTGVLTYTLNPGAIQTNATGSFINVGSGTYTIDVEDENTCIVSSNPLVITEPEILTINTELITNAYCFGTDNGSIEISITGGTGSYVYVWTTSDGSGLIDGVEDQMAVGTGTYNLTVTDDNLCEANTSFSITEPESMDIEKSIFQPFCNGTKDGVIVLSVTGGTLPLSYFWSTIDGSGLIPTNKHQSELSPAWYFIRVDDANGCIYNDSAEIIDPPVISILSESSTDASDNNANDGTITIEATGGTPPLTFTLNPGGKVSSSGIFNDLFPGEYIVEVSDFNVCGPYNSTSLTVGSTNSIYNINIDDKINIYPNPVRTVLNIDFNLELQDVYTLQLISISGQIVYNKQVDSGQSKEEIIEISSYPKGLYFIKIYNSKTSYQEKLIIQ